MSKIKFAFVSTIFVFSVLACSLISQTENSIDQNEVPSPPNTTSQSGNATSPPDQAKNVPSADPIDLDYLADFEFPIGFDTFQTTIEHNFIISDEEYGRISVEGEVSLPESASAVTILIDNTLGEAASTSKQEPLIGRVIDGVITSQVGGICNVADVNIGLPQAVDESTIFFHNSHMPSNFLFGMAEFAESDVMINGRITNRYTLNLSNFNPEARFPILPTSLDRGDLYLDSETGSLVQVVIEGMGTDEEINFEDPKYPGEIYYELNHFAFDQPVEISFLPDCHPQLETQFPVIEPNFLFRPSPDDTSVEITTPLPLEEVAEFYRVELQMDNWSLINESSFGDDQLVMEFENADGKHLNVDLMEVETPDGKITMVVIVLLPF